MQRNFSRAHRPDVQIVNFDNVVALFEEAPDGFGIDTRAERR
jgi:hypothetical protein